MTSPAVLALLAVLSSLTQIERAAPDAVAPRPPAYVNRFDPNLAALLDGQRRGGAAGLEGEARRRGIDVYGAGEVEIDLLPALGGTIDAAALAALGIDVRYASAEFTTVRIAPERAAALVGPHTGARTARVSPPLVLDRASQGVALTAADAAHALGATGAGIRIAVIDSGFIGLSALIADDQLPEPLFKKNFSSSGMESSSEHGSAVAEIVHQMAPEAELILVKISSLSHWKQAIAYVDSKNARVLNASFGFPGSNFADGTGAAAGAAKEAVERGILPVIAAGNYGDGHWLGPWTDTNDNDFLEFDGSADEGLTFAASAGAGVSIYLAWDDFPATDRDVDLQVHYVGTDASPQAPSAANLVGSSLTIQNGNDAPLEVVAFTASQTGNYAALVHRDSGPKPSQLALYLSHDVTDGNNVPESSVITPGDAEAAFTVGAIWYPQWSTGPIEDFSSRGPTLDGRVKPEIAGPDGTTSAIYGQFFGTSAATPHVAGAAAVLLSAQPDFTVAQLKNRLAAYAVPMGDANQFGAGRLDLDADFFQPTPGSAGLDAAATVLAPDQLTLVAEAVLDASLPLEFRFEYVGKANQGGDTADWQSSSSYADAGLLPNRVYKYRLRVRDSADPKNVTEPSAVLAVRTLAAAPPAPILKKTGKTSIKVKLLPGANPNSTPLALFNETDGVYVGANGKPAGLEPVFRTAAQWGTFAVKQLLPGTAYSFRAFAKNGAGAISAASDPLAVATGS